MCVMIRHRLVYFSTHRQGHFTNNHLLEQLAKTIDIFEHIHPDATGIFIFHNAPSHRKVADDGVNANRMNVGLEVKQPKMRYTVWGGTVHKLVDETRVLKRIRGVLKSLTKSFA